MKKHFNKELVMTKEDNENFRNSTKWWIYDNDYIDKVTITLHKPAYIGMSILDLSKVLIYNFY